MNYNVPTVIYGILGIGFADIYKCVIVDFFPDDINSYCGTIICPNGSVLKFDIDCDEGAYNIIEDITNQFLEKVKSGKKDYRKLWKLHKDLNHVH
jgi:hypothetical protein